MNLITRSTIAVFSLAMFLAVMPMRAMAQPAPSFLAPCGELRKAVGKLKGKDEELVTIEVMGELTSVKSDGALVYMFMCRPPDPMVLCITYETNGRKAGDRLILTGSYSQRGPNHILLDPCLHNPPE
jgi:hypothetical protein